jgi:hypothetical protein
MYAPFAAQSKRVRYDRECSPKDDERKETESIAGHETATHSLLDLSQCTSGPRIERVTLSGALKLIAIGLMNAHACCDALLGAL